MVQEAHRAAMDEIQENAFDRTIPRYVDTSAGGRGKVTR
jgi:hypothetical protein